MKVSPSTFLFSLAATFLFCQAALAASLRDQLALAEKDEDTYAQIELIRRILDKEPGDGDLREQLSDLWLAVEDYDMAESVVREWTNAPASVRARVFATALFVRDQKKAEAVALLEGFLAGHPEDIEITRQAGGLSRWNGRGQEGGRSSEQGAGRGRGCEPACLPRPRAPEAPGFRGQSGGFLGGEQGGP